MASKTATTLAGVYHPAGIYADMSVDGPEIGDLVVVVDKAKNLPNRKTIGKQDPYCAARLGKNQARKTETDKRGGQTPRWDQELRFTVHDSPDYNQLKVSVFNDDKRTDLIGETWVNLDQVVVRGGGRADGWHGLNCKGRYAGEIRIELTYYDIRPKEDSAADRTREVGRGMSETNGRESLGGPRQLTQPSRRPLPSNPMNGSPGHMGIQDHWQSSNGPDPYGQTEPRYAPDHQYLASNARPIPPQRHSEPVAAYHPPLSSRVSTQALRMEQMPQTSPLHFHPELNGPLESDIGHGYTAQESFGASDALPGNQLEFYQPMESSRQEFHSMPHPSRAEDRQRSQRQRGSPHPPGSHSQRTSPSIPPPLSHTQTAPAGMQHSQAATLYDRQGYSRDLGEYQDLNGGDFHSNDARGCGSRSRREDAYHSPYGEGRDLVHTTADDQGPPPPPAHRSSGNLVSTYQQSANDSFSHAQPPAPLNVSNNRTSMSHAYHNTRPDVREGSAPPVSPATYQGYSPNGTSPASRSPLDGLRRRSGDAMVTYHPRGSHQDIPQALIPGGASQINAGTSQLDAQGRRHTFAQGVGEGIRSSDRSPGYSSQSRSHQDLAEVSQGPPQDDGRRTHRSSAPIIKPRAVSPDPRTPARKSVSPQPAAQPDGRRLSGVPFSPDSYDAFNPNSGSSPPGAGYHTPERQETRARSDESPIVRSDGRVVDPSDHLPASTWAPEPEKKGPQASPAAVESRLRPSPLGAQPMPQSGRRLPRENLGRPQSVASPVFAHRSGPSTPENAARTRLQKRQPRPQASSPALNSSPVSPYQSNNATPQSFPRRSPVEYPLRERENLAYGNSPTHSPYGDGARNSPSGPPLPAKVPYGSGKDEFGSLSEELRSIDIGSGRRMARRAQY